MSARWLDNRLRHEIGRLLGRRWPAPAGLRPELRRWAWIFIRRYECEICDDCGRPVGRCTGSWWYADDDLYVEVIGHQGATICPPCFTRRCDALAILVFWKPVVLLRRPPASRH